jgi:DNA-3-methyladenine glycosylase
MNDFVALPESFYKPSARIVARRLLGHFLIRNTPNGPCGGAIVETEAYLSNDPACHGAIGETARNRAMWGQHGRGYVYFIYGCHFCFNAVCRPAGIAEAVLVRALEPTLGEQFMFLNRPISTRRDLTNGPAKLCAALDINRTLDSANLCDTQSPLFIARNPAVRQFLRQQGPRITTSRIGITLAAELPLRFYLAGSSFVSKRIPADSKSERVRSCGCQSVVGICDRIKPRSVIDH